MSFEHFGESADAYVDGLRDPKERRYAEHYLAHLRNGHAFYYTSGHRLPPITPSQEHRIIKRLRNTGTSRDFATRAIGGTVGTFRTKRFSADQWVGRPGREWRAAHRCSTPHGGSEADSRAKCPAWRAVSPSPHATDLALRRLHAKSGMLRTKNRAARRRGER